MSIAVICTLGPSCRDVETLIELLEAGMTAARIDLTVCRPLNLSPWAALHGLVGLMYLCLASLFLLCWMYGMHI